MLGGRETFLTATMADVSSYRAPAICTIDEKYEPRGLLSLNKRYQGMQFGEIGGSGKRQTE
jgi:hypothetical protein